jgi:N utilization substance protein B
MRSVSARRVFLYTGKLMSNMHKSRELAMQVLFLWDAHGETSAELASQVFFEGSGDPEVRARAVKMANDAWVQREITDAWLERLAPQWPPRRQPGVDRSILRLAVWEMTGFDTPPKVVIDEAIELAKTFSTEQSPSFINGVLDAVLREKLALASVGEIGFSAPPSDAAAPDAAASADIPEGAHSDLRMKDQATPSMGVSAEPLGHLTETDDKPAVGEA